MSNSVSFPFGNNDSFFNKTQPPLTGGLDDHEMVVYQKMTSEGASKTTAVAPDIEWFIQCVNTTRLNGRPLTVEQGTSLKGFLYAIVDIVLQGAVSCTLRPWFWNEVLNSWVSGTVEVISIATRLKTQVDSTESFYVEIVDIQTTTPTLVKISIAIAGTAN